MDAAILQKPLQIGDPVAFKADAFSNAIHLGKIEDTKNSHAFVRWDNGFGAWIMIGELERVPTCTGCGSTETIAAIRAKHPNALSCCPERHMQ